MEVAVILVLALVALLAAIAALFARPLLRAWRKIHPRELPGALLEEDKREIPRAIVPADAKTATATTATTPAAPTESFPPPAHDDFAPRDTQPPAPRENTHRGRSIWADTENPLLEPGEPSNEELPDCPVPLVALSVGARTDRGRRRKNNQDCFLSVPERHLFVVADGMGGHAAGEVASKMTVDTIADAYERREFGRELRPFRPARADELVAAIEMANDAVWSAAAADRAKDGMGTTVVAARFLPHQPMLYVAFVGDSRCYRLRDGLFVQLTEDHTMAQFGFAGPQADHLTRSVGIDETVLVELVSDVPIAGDVYLLCSDGLTKMVSDAMIRKVLRETEDAEAAATRLVDLANANGGKDNVTVIVVRVARTSSAGTEPGAGPVDRPRKGRRERQRRPVRDERGSRTG